MIKLYTHKVSNVNKLLSDTIIGPHARLNSIHCEIIEPHTNRIPHLHNNIDYTKFLSVFSVGETLKRNNILVYHFDLLSLKVNRTTVLYC